MNALGSIVLGLVLVGAASGCTTTTTTAVPVTSPTTTVVVPPGSTVTVAQTAPWCGGSYAVPGGTNFGSCAGR